MMQYELAPLEGITGYIYRNAYVKYFGGMDRYYTPFIASTGLNHKELNDVLPEHNKAFLLGEPSGESAVWEGPGRSVGAGARDGGKNAGRAEQLRRWEQERQPVEDRNIEKLQEDESGKTQELHWKVLWDFHQELLEGYREIMSGDQNALFKMKGLWTYFGELFPDKGKALKKIRKSGYMAQYEAAVREVFAISQDDM